MRVFNAPDANLHNLGFRTNLRLPSMSRRKLTAYAAFIEGIEGTEEGRRFVTNKRRREEVVYGCKPQRRCVQIFRINASPFSCIQAVQKGFESGDRFGGGELAVSGPVHKGWS